MIHSELCKNSNFTTRTHGMIPKSLIMVLEVLEADAIQITALLGSAKILRCVLETWVDFLSVKSQKKKTSSLCTEYRHDWLGKAIHAELCKRERGDHPNYCIIVIDQNTEKSPGDLRILAVAQTPVKTISVSWWENTLKDYNNKNNMKKKKKIIIIKLILIQRRRRR